MIQHSWQITLENQYICFSTVIFVFPSYILILFLYILIIHVGLIVVNFRRCNKHGRSVQYSFMKHDGD